MFSRSNSSFDKLLDKATSSLNLEPDWNSILTVCDYIRQGDVQPKYALNAIKKRIYAPNPHTNLFAIQVLESCIKNCGTSFHHAVATRSFMEELRDLVKVTTNEKLRDKILELLQAWAHAFRKDPNFRVIQDFFGVMKAEGYKFPPLKETEAMFEADSPPQWADGDCCYRCRVQFNVMQRKHHCRNCGQVVCAKCSLKQAIIPRFGYEKEVRVCDDCFEKLSKPHQTDPKSKIPSSTAPQGSPIKSNSVSEPSKPVGKTDQELQEEEDLQMALALSKSEAEVKDKVRSFSFSHSSLYNDPTTTTPRKERDSKSLSYEMEKYLDRSYWEAKMVDLNRSTSPAPSAPSTHYNVSSSPATNKLGSGNEDDNKHLLSSKQENGDYTSEIDMFISNLKSALEIFVNRMNSNNLRGRPIANDTAVQSLFLNITNMHSHLLKHIQEQDDARVYYESLQDKLCQIRDARAALDALRDEHREKLRLEAEEADRQRQLQMAQKLEIMRKKKQEYLQYQRQMAIQRIQEQEREMLLRQEKQKYQWQHAINQAQQIPSSYVQPNMNYQPQSIAQSLPQPIYSQYPNPIAAPSQMVQPAPMGHRIAALPTRMPFTNQNNPVTIPPTYQTPYLNSLPRNMTPMHTGMIGPQPQAQAQAQSQPQSQPQPQPQPQPQHQPQPQPVPQQPQPIPSAAQIPAQITQTMPMQMHPPVQMPESNPIQQQQPPPSSGVQQSAQSMVTANDSHPSIPAYEPKIDPAANEQPLISFD